ncbi:MAG: argininosuccinate lyase, partial [Cyclobacteriaceae bacterium]
MKLWDKGYEIEKRIEDFTVGNDRDWDRILAPYDVVGSMAHGAMLYKVGLLSKEEWEALAPALKNIYLQTLEEGFVVMEDFEDIHSQVEFELSEAVGTAGKKIHTGRSRNDQVLVDLKMFLRDEIKELVGLTKSIFTTLLELSDQHKEVIIPGYTHLQVAMPSSIGLWLSAYSETLIDDLRLLQAAFQQVNQNPLGSAAGYGSSFPIDRQLTTQLLGFETLHFNVVAAQIARGKTESMIGFSLASFGATLGKLAMDICLYNSQNFGFITFPRHFTTGSSIMPHKKNPDVFELVRGKCNHLQSIPGQLS